MKNYKILICLLTCLLYVTMSSTLPSEDLKVKHIFNKTSTLNQTATHININDDKFLNVTDTAMAASAYTSPRYHLPATMKPRGFYLPKNRPAQSTQDSAQPAAQSYYSNFFPELLSSVHSRPYYPLSEEPLEAKFISPQSQQFQQREHALSAYDASILGSGDFGIIKGGTFYPEEEIPYNNEEESSDFYNGEASNAHSGPSTEGFIQKYTFPDEQFAQFRYFADLGTPSDSAYSQYVVVYAAKNSTHSKVENSKPKNIFEQLQEIDKEKALEEKKLKKNSTNLSITKLKLVKTKLIEKKWIQKLTPKLIDDDPLLALS